METWGKQCVKMDTVIGVTFLQAKECQRLPATPQELKEIQATDSPSQASDKASPSNNIDLGLLESQAVRQLNFVVEDTRLVEHY